MKWFGGSIPEAISSAKTQNAIFVVYVYDSSDASKATDEVLVDTDISAVLSSNKFVAIKLENGTESALQFSQIYPLVLVPSLFFISGQTGLPLEVLGGPLTKETIRQKLTSLAPEGNQGASAAVTANENVKEGDTQNSSSQLEQEEDKPNSTEDGAASASALIQSPKESTPDDQASPSGLGNENKSEANVTPDSGIQDDSGTPEHEENDSEAIDDDSVCLEDKVERAKVLLAQKRASQAQEKAHEERQKEMERRKMGQEIAKRKLEQENKEIRAAAEERRKDKEEDRLARERVKAQIAADRAEREARQALLRGEEPPAAPQPRPVASVSAPAASSNNSNISRIKFRLPDGSSSIAQFSSSTTLEEVRQHVRQNINLPFSSFTLTSTVHNRPFTSEDSDRSLTDLGLVPSAILIILSSSIGGSGSVVPSGGIVDFFWILLSPITFLLGLVRQLFGGNSAPRSPSTSGSDEPTAKRAREEGPSSSQQRPQTAYGTRGEARLRREGNIHRLRNNDDDDDDENNTWNGNSTQQM
ncbi:UBX domain-containing protein 4-like isoform X2 [Penaeus chinensis]|uniref:UBX domain-containing protein 4-like isoform X2 n=1 Tax=Penaeus chinensis TaxID=139456 RepID=UPI001FB7A31E|nr:UBX domain-containing protein 4-like isoform X2 [Penaeus chinensis]